MLYWSNQDKFGCEVYSKKEVVGAFAHIPLSSFLASASISSR